MRITYPIRRLWWSLLDWEASCDRADCARPRLGISRYCRTHTNEALGMTYEEAMERRRENTLIDEEMS